MMKLIKTTEKVYMFDAKYRSEHPVEVVAYSYHNACWGLYVCRSFEPGRYWCIRHNQSGRCMVDILRTRKLALELMVKVCDCMNFDQDEDKIRNDPRGKKAQMIVRQFKHQQGR